MTAEISIPFDFLSALIVFPVHAFRRCCGFGSCCKLPCAGIDCGETAEPALSVMDRRPRIRCRPNRGRILGSCLWQVTWTLFHVNIHRLAMMDAVLVASDADPLTCCC